MSRYSPNEMGRNFICTKCDRRRVMGALGVFGSKALLLNLYASDQT